MFAIRRKILVTMSRALPAIGRLLTCALLWGGAMAGDALASAVDQLTDLTGKAVVEIAIAAIGRDLRVWVRRLPEYREWKPAYFEFSFGLADEGRDPRSIPEPVTIDERFRLRPADAAAAGGAWVAVVEPLESAAGRLRLVG